MSIIPATNKIYLKPIVKCGIIISLKNFGSVLKKKYTLLCNRFCLFLDYLKESTLLCPDLILLMARVPVIIAINKNFINHIGACRP